MLTMNELVDLRMQQQIAHEIYRQQIMQRIPDPFPSMLPMHMPHHVIMPPRPTLPGVEAHLENNDLWKQFHKIGTEMIITKSGRRMFPSMRVTLAGLEEETNYCVLLEMVPMGDCRYKFSGSQWVPAGGAEPQSPQRIFLHPDSPATGAHWQSQAILFNKVKLTNNTLDSNGHIVLASMHKYQPRLHIIRTSDLAQLPWAPQQAFVFPETEFVAVTAYQNDRITKLKIDNNPFAKGFRETGQSRCKRKLAALHEEHEQGDFGTNGSCKAFSTQSTEDDRSSVGSFELTQAKRLRSNGSFDDETGFSSSSSSNGTMSPRFDEGIYHHHHHHHQHASLYHRTAALDLAAAAYFNAPPHAMHAMLLEPHHLAHLPTMPPHQLPLPQLPYGMAVHAPQKSPQADASVSISDSPVSTPPHSPAPVTSPSTQPPTQAKRNNFSISAILAY